MISQQRVKRPRQSDVARLAGVSQATVSAVLNSHGDTYGLGEETRKRVLSAIRELGYVANPAARNLRGQRTGLLGVHTFEPVFPVSSTDFYHEFLIGIEEQATHEEFDLVLFSSTGDSEGKRRVFRNGLNRLNIADGSILLGTDENSTDLGRLAEERYPFVHIGRREVPGFDVAYVSPDYRTATAAVVERLARLGHRQIAYLGARIPIEPIQDRRNGYLDGCRTTGIAPRPVEAVDANRDWLSGIMSGGATAVLVEDYAKAARVSRLARQAGLSIPADLSLVVLNQPPNDDHRRWSAVDIPRRQVGRRAVRLLVEMLADQLPAGENHVLMPCGSPSNATMAPAPL